jgi:hypothetical protein
MNEEEVRKKCEAFVQSLGMPCFIVFGWEKKDDEAKSVNQKQYGMVSTYHEMPTPAVVKGMTWALSDIVNKAM